MNVDADALALIQSLERASRRTRPFLMYGLVAVIIGFGALIYNLEEQRRAAEERAVAAEERAVAAETLVRTLREAQRSGGSPEVLSRALSQAEALSSSLSEAEGSGPRRAQPARVKPLVPPAATPIPPATPSVAPAVETELARREQFNAVREGQRLLAATGYDAGPADGVLGARTQALIRRYQRQHGLTESGTVDEATLRALRSAPAAVTAGSPRGPRRAATMEAQQLLERIDYDVGTVDGFAGARTRAAIAKYQQEQGLAVSGVADEATLRSLRETAEVYRAPPPSQPAAARPTAQITAEAQELLKRLGYPIGAIDGRRGLMTQALIRSFQEENGLPATGVADEATIRALRAKAAGQPPSDESRR